MGKGFVGLCFVAVKFLDENIITVYIILWDSTYSMKSISS